MDSLYGQLSTLLTILALGFAAIGFTRMAIRYQRGEYGWDNELLPWFGGMILFLVSKIAVNAAFQV